MRYASFLSVCLDKVLGVSGQHTLQSFLGVLFQLAGGADGLHHGSAGCVGIEILVQAFLVLGHGRHLDVHEVVVDGRVEDGHLFFDRERERSGSA